jgi:hypothetical protein
LRQDVDLKDFEERIVQFSQLAEDSFATGLYSREYVKLRTDRLRLTLEAYNLLNDAYKEKRIAPGHNTEPPKIAGLMAMAIMKIRPFRSLPLTSSRPASNPWPTELRIQDCWPNEFYAVACGGVIAKFVVNANSDADENLLYRITEVIHDLRSQTLHPFWEDIYHARKRDFQSYQFDLAQDDLHQLNYTMTIFELLAR